MRSTWKEMMDTAIGWMYFLSMYLFVTVLIISGVEIFRSKMDPRFIIPILLRWEVLVIIFSMIASVFIHLYKLFFNRLFSKAGFVRAFIIYFPAYIIAFASSIMMAYYIPLLSIGLESVESSVTFVMILVVIFRATPRHNINDPVGPVLHTPIEDVVKDELKGYGFFHGGVDFNVPKATPVFAAGDGRISMAIPYGASGNLVKIKHDPNFSTSYAHLNEMIVQRGQEVKRGELIGFTGNTGHSFHPHLHFEVQFKNRVVDPMKYIVEFNEKSKGKGKGKGKEKGRKASSNEKTAKR